MKLFFLPSFLPYILVYVVSIWINCMWGWKRSDGTCGGIKLVLIQYVSVQEQKQLFFFETSFEKIAGVKPFVARALKEKVSNQQNGNMMSTFIINHNTSLLTLRCYLILAMNVWKCESFRYTSTSAVKADGPTGPNFFEKKNSLNWFDTKYERIEMIPLSKAPVLLTNILFLFINMSRFFYF